MLIGEHGRPGPEPDKEQILNDIDAQLEALGVFRVERDRAYRVLYEEMYTSVGDELVSSRPHGYEGYTEGYYFSIVLHSDGTYDLKIIPQAHGRQLPPA